MTHTKAVLIIGGSGFIGTHLALKLRDNYKVVATYNKHRIVIPGVTMIPLGVENRNWVKRIAYTFKPDVIIYAAGRNDLAWAEENSRLADGIHANGPITVSGASDIVQHRFIYLSNCYTFDGTRGDYHENENTVPITALGKAKSGGENFIRGRSINHIVIRSSPLYGRGNGSSLTFLDQLRMSLSRGETIEMSDDELHSFAPVNGLVEVIVRILETGIRNRVFHYGGLTKVSYFEFAKSFAKKFKFDPNLVIPKKSSLSSESEGKSIRADYSLNFTQAVHTFKIPPLDLDSGFESLASSLR